MKTKQIIGLCIFLILILEIGWLFITYASSETLMVVKWIVVGIISVGALIYAISTFCD